MTSWSKKNLLQDWNELIKEHKGMYATSSPSQFSTFQEWTFLPCTSAMLHKLFHTSIPTFHGNHHNTHQRQCGVQSWDACLLLAQWQCSLHGKTEKLGHFFPNLEIKETKILKSALGKLLRDWKLKIQV